MTVSGKQQTKTYSSGKLTEGSNTLDRKERYLFYTSL